MNRLIRRPRIQKHSRTKTPALRNCPQKKGICTNVYTMTPRKPNSGIRKVAKIRLTNKAEIIAYIRGEGHTLQEHSIVLIHGGRVPDLPGVRYRCIRGKYDLLGVANRHRRRSIYGTKKSK